MAEYAHGRDDGMEWDRLTTALNRLGINHVAPGEEWAGPVPTGEDLFGQLATSRHVRLQEAIIPLLLTCPDLDDDARRAIARLDGRLRLKAQFRYVAAGALQRLWWTRLTTDLGPRRPIEPAYLDELGLPPLTEDFGRETLLALSNREEELFGYDAWAGYTSLMDVILNEIVLAGWGNRDARAR